ncbi:GntR family transcriptional regulator [Brucella sp. BE17]|uniref:GntR family transcriptional regulator n=1 Tax=Brucella sp. BE17 TaxID=3142977 RepID=UPI0031BA1ACF
MKTTVQKPKAKSTASLSQQSGAGLAASARRISAGRITTATVIYRELHTSIVSMQLTPGTPLNEKALTEQFGVSRTPVREAIIRLVEDGLVDVFPQSGTFVARIPVALIPEAVIIRQALEGATTERAATSATSGDIDLLDEILARQSFFAERQNLGSFHEADDAFHEAIASIAHHPGIWQFLKPVKVQIDRARRMTVPALGRMTQVIAEHKIIRNAIESHDVTAACAAMKHHLSAVKPDIDELRKSNPDSFI